METFIAIVIAGIFIINVITFCIFVFGNSGYVRVIDFVFSSLFLGILGFPGALIGNFVSKIDRENRYEMAEIQRKKEEEERKNREEEKRKVENEKIEKSLTERASQIEKGEIFMKLLSFVTENEMPYKIDFESEGVTVYLNGKEKYFDFLLNGIEKIYIPFRDEDSRNTDLYALAFTVKKHLNADFDIQPETKVYKSGDEYYHKTIKVSLKRKLQRII